MANLPVLLEGGVVVFETADDLDVSVERFLSKGALAVTPRCALSPLQQLDVVVTAPFLVERPVLSVEVVQLDAVRAVLRLLAPFDVAVLKARTAPAGPPLPAAPPAPAVASPAEPDASAVMKMRAAPGPPRLVEDAPLVEDLPLVEEAAPPVEDLPLVEDAAPAVEVAATVEGRAPRPCVAPADGAVLEDGLVRFASLRAFSKAAVLLASGQPLTALVGPGARFDVTEALQVVVGAYAHSSQLTATTKRDGDAAVVQFTNKTLVTSALRAIEAGAIAAGEEPASGSAPAAPSPPPASASPPPQLSASGLTPAHGTPVATWTGQAPAHGTAASGTGSTAQPPVYGDGQLQFVSRDQYRALHEHLATMGAIMAACAAAPSPGSEHEVQLVVSGAPARGRVRCVVFPASPGLVVVQAIDAKAWRPLLDELDAESQVMPRAPQGQRTLNLPRKGTLENPTTAAGVRMPAHKPPNEEDARWPSSVLLLRWLRAQVGVHRLELVVEGQPVHTAIIVDGREVRSPVALTTLARALAAPKLEYELHEIVKPPLMSTTGRTLHLITEVLRALMAKHSTEELMQAFPAHPDEAPRAVAHIVEGVGLPPQHARFVKSWFTGDHRMEEIHGAPGLNARIVLDVYVLELFGAIQ